MDASFSCAVNDAPGSIRGTDDRGVSPAVGASGADNRLDQIRVGQIRFTVEPGPPVRHPVWRV